MSEKYNFSSMANDAGVGKKDAEIFLHFPPHGKFSLVDEKTSAGWFGIFSSLNLPTNVVDSPQGEISRREG